MKKEIRGLFEIELAETLDESEILDVPALPGAAIGDRPDECVLVVVQTADTTAVNSYLLGVDIYCVAPVDDAGAIANSKSRLAEIENWMLDSDCPLIGSQNADGSLVVHGFTVTATRRETKERSAAEILHITVGASVDYTETVDIPVN